MKVWPLVEKWGSFLCQNDNVLQTHFCTLLKTKNATLFHVQLKLPKTVPC
jgi:hypothetical protein